MQPKDPAPGDAPDPWPATPAPEPAPSAGAWGAGSRKRGRLQSRRARLALAMGAGILALLCIGGASLVFLFYDEATEIDRSQPDTVTDSFLIAYLVNRDDGQARLFTCANPDLTSIEALRAEMLKREKGYPVKVSVSWGALFRTSVGRGSENVSAELTISSTSSGKFKGSRNEEWVFQVREEGEAWRVCGAEKSG